MQATEDMVDMVDTADTVDTVGIMEDTMADMVVIMADIMAGITDITTIGAGEAAGVDTGMMVITDMAIRIITVILAIIIVIQAITTVQG